jgi:hypothetical protein
MKKENIIFKSNDFHSHLKSRMLQRGVTKEEIEITLKNGWKADDAKTGMEGKVFVFSYNRKWEGKYFAEKEVTVYYKFIKGKILLLTVKSRYGENFSKGGGGSANRI